jgi:hypothetical protein
VIITSIRFATESWIPGWERLGNRDFADDHHVTRDFDQLVKTEFPLVHAIQHGRGNCHFIGTRHHKRFISVYGDIYS